MSKNMIWNEEQGKMVEAGITKGEAVKITVSADLAEKLKSYAIEDGYDLTGISYVTVKKDGKTVTKDGKPVYVMVDGKPKTIPIDESVAKINSAIRQYVEVAVRKLIANRPAKTE